MSEKLNNSNRNVFNLRKRKLSLESKVTTLQNALREERSEFDDATYFSILAKADAIPYAVINSYATKLRKCEEKKSVYIERNYSEEIRKFAITLFSYSKRSYEYVRETMGKCLPAISTIRKWLDKVDGSPGFNNHALAKLREIVEQKKMLSQKLYVSYILDEMHLKKHTFYDGKVNLNISFYLVPLEKKLPPPRIFLPGPRKRNYPLRILLPPTLALLEGGQKIIGGGNISPFLVIQISKYYVSRNLWE